MYNIIITDSGYDFLKKLIRKYTLKRFQEIVEKDPDNYAEIIACMMLLDDLNNAKHYEG